MNAWPENLKNAKKAPTSGAMNLFDRGDSEALNEDDREIFHSVVAKGLFVGNRYRPNILTTICVLSSWVKVPNEDDWLKARRLVQYLKETQNILLILK